MGRTNTGRKGSKILFLVRSPSTKATLWGCRTFGLGLTGGVGVEQRVVQKGEKKGQPQGRGARSGCRRRNIVEEKMKSC